MSNYLDYPNLLENDLPINNYRDQLIKAIDNNQILIICGETGSGKSTQLPKFCLQSNSFKADKKIRLIGHTQPRRMAAISLANRIASELQTEFTNKKNQFYPLDVADEKFVGYKIRFDEKVSPTTVIKLMTDGILLAEISHDPQLKNYQFIIIDEAHERNINIDFLLGYLKGLLFPPSKTSKRLDLKVIITSATLEADKFSKFFNNAPVFSISGRNYPVSIYYRSIKHDKNIWNLKNLNEKEQAWQEDKYEKALPLAISYAIKELWEGSDDLKSLGYGDILVFLPGETEILESMEYLKNNLNNLIKHANQLIEILPLFSRLSATEQMLIFNPPKNKYRIILSTNIAETTLTVPRIKYVIDSGLARIMRFSPRQKINRLEIEPIAQDSAKQRSGRCGRLSEGICIRLYDVDDFNTRPIFTSPEIARSSLALVILRQLAMKLGSISEFAWLDQPSPRIIQQGINELTQLSAIQNNVLTNIGSQMAQMPISHSLSRMLIEADRLHILAPMLIIVSGLSTQEVREIPQDQIQKAKSFHQQFNHPISDFLTILNLWKKIEEKRTELITNRAFRKWCNHNYLSWYRIKQWRELHLQLQVLSKRIFKYLNKKISQKYNINDRQFIDSIHKSILIGSPFNIGRKHEIHNQFIGTNGLKFLVEKSWNVKKVNWVLVGEVVATKKNSLPFARKIAKINPDLIYQTLGDKLDYKELHLYWDHNRGKVMRFCQVSLGGLIINPRKSMELLENNDEHQNNIRRLFIEEGLIGEKLLTSKFIYLLPELKEALIKNQKSIELLENKDHCLRTLNAIISDEQLYQFYDQALPLEINDFFELQKLIKKNNKLIKALTLNPQTWLNQKTKINLDDYPGELICNGMSFKITYIFAPNQLDDGITITVPLEILSILEKRQIEWLIPGMLYEKVSELIKTLPKNLRIKLRTPKIIENFVFEYKKPPYPPIDSLSVVLAKYCSRIIGEKINPSSFLNEKIPKHLQMRILVVNDDGRTIGFSKDLKQLQEEFLSNKTKDKNHQRLQVKLIREVNNWDFGQLPQNEEIKINNYQINCDLALYHHENNVYLAAFVNSKIAGNEHQKGLIELTKKNLKLQIDKFLKQAPKIVNLKLPLIWFENDEIFHQSMINLIIRNYLLSRPLPQNQQEFNIRVKECKSNFLIIANSLEKIIAEISQKYHQITSIINNSKSQSYINKLAQDIHSYLDRIFFEKFLDHIDYQVLIHYPRYLEAIIRRIEKYPKNPERDQKNAQVINNFWELLSKLQNQKTIDDKQYKLIFFHLNELSVSLYAQELKTSIPISITKLEKIINELRL